MRKFKVDGATEIFYINYSGNIVNLDCFYQNFNTLYTTIMTNYSCSHINFMYLVNEKLNETELQILKILKIFQK